MRSSIPLFPSQWTRTVVSGDSTEELVGAGGRPDSDLLQPVIAAKASAKKRPQRTFRKFIARPCAKNRGASQTESYRAPRFAVKELWQPIIRDDVRPHPGPLPQERGNRSPRSEPCDAARPRPQRSEGRNERG